MAHLPTHFTSRKIRPTTLAPHLRSLNSSFFSPEFSASCSTVLFIEIFDGWSISCTHTKNNLWILTRNTHSHIFKTHSPTQSFHQSSENTTCSQSPPSIARSKDPTSSPSWGIINLSPTFPPPLTRWFEFVAKFPQRPQSPSPLHDPGSPPIREADNKCIS